MSNQSIKKVDIFTDGACKGNPGRGGFGAILCCLSSRKEISGGYRWTTNNRMELMALIQALSFLKESCLVTIHSDSKYLLGGFDSNWVRKWKKNGWKTSTKKQVQNCDLWIKLDQLLSSHNPSFVWIKGHSSHVDNDRCDELAVAATQCDKLQIDVEYEAINPFQEKKARRNLIPQSDLFVPLEN